MTPPGRDDAEPARGEPGVERSGGTGRQSVNDVSR